MEYLKTINSCSCSNMRDKQFLSVGSIPTSNTENQKKVSQWTLQQETMDSDNQGGNP